MSTSNGHLPQWGLLDAAGDQGEGMPGLAGHDIRGEGHGGGAGRDVPGSVSFTGTLPSGVGAATATTAWEQPQQRRRGAPLMELLDAAGDQGEGMPGLAGHDVRGEGHGGGAGRD